MRVKVPPLRRQVTPYLATSSRGGNLRGEAGSRAESEAKQIATLPKRGEVARANKA